MKKYLLFLTFTIGLLAVSSNAIAQNDQKEAKTALIIIDIQDFYFPGGMLPLQEPEKAASNAKILLETFRENNDLVIHVKHNASSGANIHALVKPLGNEKIITKNKANAFVGTDLLDYLRDHQVQNLVLCGMQTHMCLEAATRAGADYGFQCTVVEDACTTRDLTYEDVTVKAKDVHFSTLSTLKGGYAKVINTEMFLKQFQH